MTNDTAAGGHTATTNSTTDQPTLAVTQADRDAVQAFHRLRLNKLMEAIKDEKAGARLGEDEGDAGDLVQAFARHRTNSEPRPAGDLREAAIESLVAAWHGGWSYDFGPCKVPNGPIEVAFDAGLGFTHVKICERIITRSMATYDRPLPVDQYEYGYRDQDGKDVSDGCRPYAWRKIALPPHPRPFDDGVRDVEAYIHNHCPDKVRDHFAALTARATIATHSPAPMAGWRDMNDAPKDGSHILAWFWSTLVGSYGWADTIRWWNGRWWDDRDGPCEPAAWMPRPAPPVAHPSTQEG